MVRTSLWTLVECETLVESDPLSPSEMSYQECAHQPSLRSHFIVFIARQQNYGTSVSADIEEENAYCLDAPFPSYINLILHPLHNLFALVPIVFVFGKG